MNIYLRKHLFETCRNYCVHLLRWNTTSSDCTSLHLLRLCERYLKRECDRICYIGGAGRKYFYREGHVVVEYDSRKCFCSDVCQHNSGCPLRFIQCDETCRQGGGHDALDFNTRGFDDFFGIVAVFCEKDRKSTRLNSSHSQI